MVCGFKNFSIQLIPTLNCKQGIIINLNFDPNHQMPIGFIKSEQKCLYHRNQQDPSSLVSAES